MNKDKTLTAKIGKTGASCNTLNPTLKTHLQISTPVRLDAKWYGLYSLESESEFLYCPANGEISLPKQPKDSSITKNNNSKK